MDPSEKAMIDKLAEEADKICSKAASDKMTDIRKSVSTMLDLDRYRDLAIFMLEHAAEKAEEIKRTVGVDVRELVDSFLGVYGIVAKLIRRASSDETRDALAQLNEMYKTIIASQEAHEKGDLDSALSLMGIKKPEESASKPDAQYFSMDDD